MDADENVVCSHCNTQVHRQWLLDHVREELQSDTLSQHCSLCSDILQMLTDLLCALHQYKHLIAPVISITCSRCSFKAGSVEMFAEHLQMRCKTDSVLSYDCHSDGVKHDPPEVYTSHRSTAQTGFALKECYLPNNNSEEDTFKVDTCEKTVGLISQGDEKTGEWDGQQFQQMMSMLLTDTSGTGRSREGTEQDVGQHSKVTIDIASVCETVDRQGMKWKGSNNEQTSVHENQDAIGQQCMNCKEYEEQTSNQVREEENAAAGNRADLEHCSQLTNRKIQKTDSEERDDCCNNDQYIAANRNRHKTRKVLLECHLCNYSSQRREILESHMLETHGKVEYKCYSCNFIAKSPKNLQRHQLVHQRIHKCRYCHFTTRWHNSLVLHERRHTGEGMMKCDHCDYVTPDKDGLLRHQIKHRGEKPFVCGQCNKAFARKCELKRHELRHAGIKSAMCHICGDTFQQKQSLVHHIQAQHHGLKMYKCDQCPFETGYNSSLLTHRRAHHTHEKPYRCEFEGCSYASASTSQLKVHRRKHTGEKPFKCTVCNYASADNAGLRKHVRRHSSLRPYKCNICDFDTKHSFLLRKHMETTHNVMNNCKFNQRQLSSMVSADVSSENNKVAMDIFSQNLQTVENQGHGLGEVQEGH